MKHLFAIAALAAATLPAQAALIDNAAALGAAPVTADFDAFEGLLTQGPLTVAPGVVFSGDTGSEIGAYVRDLGENGAWGVGERFAASGLVGELRFTFDELSRGAGAFVNHYALEAFTLGVVVSVYGDNHQIIESHTLTVDTPWDSYNQGVFVGILRDVADIRSISFKGVGVVIDDLSVATPVPEPESLALMTGGLAMLGWLARRRRAD